jgi:vancomycin permeability regulator SanA
MKKKYPKIYTLIFSFVLILQLIFLYYIKYLNQGLTLNDFSFNNIGNIFNLVVTLCLIIGIIFYFKRKHHDISSLMILIIISTLTLFIIYLLTLIEVPSLKFYVLGQPGEKIVEAALFTLYQFILFVSISFIWLNALLSDSTVFSKSLFNAVVMLLFFLAITFVFILTRGYSSDNWSLTKSDKNVAVVLGAAVWSDNQPSPSLSGRVDKGIQLYINKFVGSILLTGSNAPGEMSEAEVALEYARERGMDMEKVRYESLTTSTSEQIKYIKKYLINDENINDVIVVSNAYHLLRIIEISKFFNINIKVAAPNSYLNYKKKLYMQLRESIALIVFWCFAL